MTNIFDQMASEEGPGDPTVEHALVTDDTPAQHSASVEDVGQTSPDIKAVVQELLKHGYVEETNRQELFRRIIIHQQSMSKALEPLDLTVRIDSHRGVAFLVIAPKSSLTRPSEVESDEDSWSHPLVRKQRLTLEQSLLVAVLRQAFVMHEQESGVGQSPAKIAVDELLPNFLAYFGESGSDSRDENRLLQLLDQLKAHGIVSEVDKKHEVTIRPLIAHLASPESLKQLLSILKDKKQPTSDADIPDGSVESA
ncbi:DUF4194 domain-containing protein [Bremerella sp. T1]|uniref:DUF4194 domain-containing protein n=1 Tax=Bremerella sp. TYQ1 TaxID=3119568 RepID=UPI001CCBE1F5|nr:DUF4194 domain-containing protein [Bremerella volcania]UBM36737.1 DUF4194 domain-containing protein [Bremerella volcania]